MYLRSRNQEVDSFVQLAYLNSIPIKSTFSFIREAFCFFESEAISDISCSKTKFKLFCDSVQTYPLSAAETAIREITAMNPVIILNEYSAA